MFNVHWTPPKYKTTQKLPFIPTEKEIDALIAASGTKLSAFLRTLKETGMRSGEASKLRWIDVDKKNAVITVNNRRSMGIREQYESLGNSSLSLTHYLRTMTLCSGDLHGNLWRATSFIKDGT
jgi:integrase